MRIYKIILSILLTILPSCVQAQDVYPSISPTASYTDDEGNPATSYDNIQGQAPLTVEFKANPENLEGYNATFEWHFRMENESSDFIVRYEENTEYTFTNAGTTLVTLYMKLNNETQDVDSVVFNVSISESKLVFPNAFSPNGDGINDVFKAKEYQSLVEFHAYIFNRWGQKLYDWTDPAEGWDGTSGGKEVKDGVYFVLVKAKGADGRDYNIRKDVNLLRGFIENTTNN